MCQLMTKLIKDISINKRTIIQQDHLMIRLPTQMLILRASMMDLSCQIGRIRVLDPRPTSSSPTSPKKNKT